MFLPLDILFEYRIEHLTFGRLHVMFRFSNRIFYRGVPRFVTNCSCGVWCREYNHLPPVCCSTFWILVWDDSGFPSWHNGEQRFHYFQLCFTFVFTYILMPHNMIAVYFLSPYFHVSKSGSFNTLILSFYIDVVLTLSIIYTSMYPNRLTMSSMKLSYAIVQKIICTFASPISMFPIHQYWSIPSSEGLIREHAMHRVKTVHVTHHTWQGQATF